MFIVTPFPLWCNVTTWIGTKGIVLSKVGKTFHPDFWILTNLPPYLLEWSYVYDFGKWWVALFFSGVGGCKRRYSIVCAYVFCVFDIVFYSYFLNKCYRTVSHFLSVYYIFQFSSYIENKVYWLVFFCLVYFFTITTSTYIHLNSNFESC